MTDLKLLYLQHFDTDNIHNHFLINSNFFKDVKRYFNMYKDMYNMRKVSNELCLQYVLSIVEEKYRKVKIMFIISYYIRK